MNWRVAFWALLAVLNIMVAAVPDDRNVLAITMDLFLLVCAGVFLLNAFKSWSN